VGRLEAGREPGAVAERRGDLLPVSSSPAISIAPPDRSSGRIAQRLRRADAVDGDHRRARPAPAEHQDDHASSVFGAKKLAQFSMKNVGRTNVVCRPSAVMCSSTRRLLSKWGMPV
jgi:hypothetical protein